MGWIEEEEISPLMLVILTRRQKTRFLCIGYFSLCSPQSIFCFSILLRILEMVSGLLLTKEIYPRIDTFLFCSSRHYLLFESAQCVAIDIFMLLFLMLGFLWKTCILDGIGST